MRRIGALLLFACLAAEAQIVPRVVGEPLWRRNIIGSLGQAPGTMNVRDVERFEQYLLFAGPYCYGLTAAQYQANQVLARQMTSYWGAVNAAAVDAATRTAAVRVSRALGGFSCAVMPAGGVVPPAPPFIPGDPPFSMQPPDLGNVAAADKENANELRSRYAFDAAKAAVAWQNAEKMRFTLAARGMGLNAQTAASVGRFQLLLTEAGESLVAHNWEEALSNLQGVEQETQKVGKVVGQ